MKRFLAALAFFGFFGAAHAQQGTIIQPPSCAIAGCTMTGSLTVSGASLITSGNFSASAWATSGIRDVHAAASYTDTSSSGTVAAAYTDLFGASTILASSATVYTNYFGAYFKDPVASTNVTMTNKYALGADSSFITSMNTSTSIAFTAANVGLVANNGTKYVYNNGGTTFLSGGSNTSGLTIAGGGVVSGTSTIPGVVSITGGAQPITSGTAAGGNVTITGGAASGSGSSGNGGNVVIGGGATVGGTAGTIQLTGLTTGTNADFLCLSAGNVILIQTSACTISSVRFKENIAPVSDRSALAIVDALRPVAFNLKPMERPNADPNFGRRQIGLLAENVASVDARMAVYEDDGATPKSYRQESVIAALVGAVHELKADNDNLRADLATMKKASGDRR